MTLPSITIASSALSPSTKTVLCRQLKVSHKRAVNTSPNANGTDIVQAQTQSYENPLYVLSGLLFAGGSTVLSYDDCVTLTKLDYNGSNAPLLTVTYGKPGATAVLANDAATTTGASVVVETFNITIDTSESQGGYLPSGTITLRETA